MSEALSSWGEKDGAIIVVSHDKSFCDSVGFNAVGTVANGELTIEERSLNQSDWKRYDMVAQTSDEACAEENTKTLTPEEKEEWDRKRKSAFNAPKRIEKIEQKIEEIETEIAAIDDEMMEVGTDVGKLTDLSEKKEQQQSKIDDLMIEWEELELLLEEVQ